VDPWTGDAGAPPAAAAELLGADITSRLERWAAEARVDDAARRRSRERWLQRQASEEASLAGVLCDLAERGTPVAVRTRAGRLHRGRVRAVGVDFLALAGTTAGDVVVALAAVSSVRTRPGEAPATGDRPTGAGLRLADVVAGLAAERDRAMIVPLDGDEALVGEVRSVGGDVVVVRLDAEAAATAYVPLDAVGEIVLGV